MAAVTLYDVAAHAGVSQSTASRVLNGSHRTPGAAVVDRVIASARILGYVPNAQAQALARSASGLIGLVVHDITDPYFSIIARGVQDAARASGRQVLLASTDAEPQAERQAVTALIGYRIDALILAGSRRTGPADPALTAELQRYQQGGGRVTFIGQAWPGAGAVVPANASGAAALAQALIAGGHRRFAVLAGPRELRTPGDRTRGFLRAMTRSALSPAGVFVSPFTRDGGLAATLELLAGLDPRAGKAPFCIFAVNDVMAMGAIAALRESGYRVPEDVQVAGFDDIPTLRDYTPALSTVRLPLVSMGRRAVELAFGTPDGSPSRVIRSAGAVVLRESTEICRAGSPDRAEEIRPNAREESSFPRAH